MLIKSTLTLIVLLSCLLASNSYKILLLAPLPGLSHWGMMQNIINELLNRGHEVTAISSFELKRDSNSMQNYTDVRVEPKLNVNAYCEYFFLKFENIVFFFNYFY